MLIVVLLNIFILTVIILSAILLCVVMLSAAAPASVGIGVNEQEGERALSIFLMPMTLNFLIHHQHSEK
jgi:hypothetical protein